MGDRLYLSEPMIREAALTKLGQGVAEALGGGYRAPGKTGQFTQILLKALHDRGWLVTEAEGVPEGSETSKTWTLPADQALWRVRSGIIEFRGMIAVELPEEHHGLYPRETAYEVTVIGPLRTSAGSGVVPTKDSGKREERAEIPKGIPASEVCEVSLFAASQPGGEAGKVEPPAAGGDVAPKGEEPAPSKAQKDSPPWLLEDGDSASTASVSSGDAAPMDEPVGGNAAPKEAAAAVGDAAPKGDPVGGDAAPKGGEAAGAGVVPAQDEASKSDVSWLLDDGFEDAAPPVSGGDAAPKDDPIGGNAAPKEAAAAGGDAAPKDEPVGGDAAPKGGEAAGAAGEPAPEQASKHDASWLLEDDDSASTAPANGGDTAPKEAAAAGGNAAPKGDPVGGDVAPKGEQAADAAGEPSPEQAPKHDASWLLEDDHGASKASASGGDAAPKDDPVGGNTAPKEAAAADGNAAPKGEQAADAAGEAAPEHDASWLLEDDDSANTASASGGDAAPKEVAAAGGDAAPKGDPIGGDAAPKGEEPTPEQAPKHDASWLLEDDDSASTAPASGGNTAPIEVAAAGGNAAPKDDPVGGDAAPKEAAASGGDTAPKDDPVGGDVAPKGEQAEEGAQEAEAKLSPIERRLQKRRAKAKKAAASHSGGSASQAGSDNGAGAKGKRAKAEVAGPPKLFS
ncbi:hypothetical protein [Vreelandella salicampi]|uniref:Uncharacterized protein n=1 Tax=Vreelandella salicampi TaxID=1449798 RepID=A0A7Z0LN38_9GAMM|nr:hypothetical protein [Halomonas salicampi]NYS61925.1 hypothetical protein [Halomonas salicampi]